MIRHILIQDQNNDCSTAMTWAPEGNKKRGRPKTNWRRTVEKERKKENRIVIMRRSEARTIAANREKWKDSAKALCANSHNGG